MHIDAQEIRQGGAGGCAWKYLEVAMSPRDLEHRGQQRQLDISTC